MDHSTGYEFVRGEDIPEESPSGAVQLRDEPQKELSVELVDVAEIDDVHIENLLLGDPVIKIDEVVGDLVIEVRRRLEADVDADGGARAL